MRIFNTVKKSKSSGEHLKIWIHVINNLSDGQSYDELNMEKPSHVSNKWQDQISDCNGCCKTASLFIHMKPKYCNCVPSLLRMFAFYAKHV